MDKFSELSRPVRIHRDWNRASMCHCGKCDRWEMTIADADGVQTCASCYDAEWLSEWQNYAEAAEKRIAELEAKLATPARAVDVVWVNVRIEFCVNAAARCWGVEN